MKLTDPFTDCKEGPCPTIFSTDRGTVVFQGYAVADADAEGVHPTPAGETRAELPLDLVLRWLDQRREA